jgi:hypothetical protein
MARREFVLGVESCSEGAHRLASLVSMSSALHDERATALDFVLALFLETVKLKAFEIFAAWVHTKCFAGFIAFLPRQLWVFAEPI